ncbi:MAG: signal recognition particle-docking protein FtsY [Polyangiaceae bacterium]|nr:signal recognition particle-docking protein FtsY [Polyangiaceae bacterium]MCW5791769.1 signal recognition particle-docking protein FtsY [Polyangiaceae bacterium]
MIYAIIAVVVLAIVGYLLMSRRSAGELPPAQTPEKLPEAKEPAPKSKTEPAKSAEKSKDRQATVREPRPREEPKAASERPAPPSEAEPEAAPTSEAAPPSDAPASDGDRPSLTSRRDLKSLRKGLARSRESEGFFGRLKALVTGRREVDPAIAEEIEEILLAGDVGVKTTEALLERLKEGLAKGELKDADAVWRALRAEALRTLNVGDPGAFKLRDQPTVVLLVGVNGAGKTTTIGKLATRLTQEGQRCVLAAGDTFRAAAVQQLVVWGDRVGCEVVRGKDGADPGSVIFEAIERAKATGADVVLADTAGRLHTKTNLMVEMKKIAKTAGKALDGAPHEVLLVLDATNGQNALAQAREFKDALDLTGVVLTKLDGTAKGGMVLGIADELRVPVRFIGLGERASDLHDFVPEDFVEALLGHDEG